MDFYNIVFVCFSLKTLYRTFQFKAKKAELDEFQIEIKSLEQMNEKKQLELDDVKRRFERVQSDLSEVGFRIYI